MSTPKLISPLLDNFMMGEPISDSDGIRCCPAMNQLTQDKYLVKIISIPANQTKLEALLLAGAYPDADAASGYFMQQANEIADEVNVLNELSHNSGFEGYEAYQIVPMEGATGYEVYLLCPYRMTLERHCHSEAITHLDASNMALDICAALAACRNQGYIYLNLKPGNIYLSNEKNYRIGDLGLLKINGLKYATIPDRYFSPYMAPELTDAFSIPNETADTYALGMILYELYNGALPFNGAHASLEQLPAPQYADEEIAQIILKACAPDPADRWQTPAQMGQALVSYIQRNGISDKPIVTLQAEPEVISEEADIKQDIITETTSGEEEVICEIQPEEADNSTIATEECNVEEIEVDSEQPGDTIGFEIQEPDTAENQETDPIDAIIESVDEIIESEAAEEENNVQVIDESDSDADVPDANTVCEDTYENLTFMDEDGEESATEDEDIDSLLDKVDALITEENDAEETEEQTEDPEQIAMPDLNSDDEVVKPVKKSRNKWIGWVLAAILFIGLLVGGYFFYTMYYLQPVNSLFVINNIDAVIIDVECNLDSSELLIVLTDENNTENVIPLIDSKATISGLQPDMTYTVTVKATGFHKLTGNTSTTFSTQKETEVLNLTVVTGSTSGTAEVSFQVDGPDSETWTATFESEEEMFISLPFSGHNVTFNNLTVGTLYNVSIAPSDELFISGATSTTYTATELIIAEDLAVTSFAENSITAAWNIPDGQNVESWSVCCTNASGFSQILNVTSPEAKFDGIDLDSDYTIRVTAAGQSASAQINVAAGAPTVNNLVANATSNNIHVSWASPEGNWIVRYELVGSDVVGEARCIGNSVTIYSVVPGQTYKIVLLTEDGVQAAHAATKVTIPTANDFNGYTISRENMQFSMCKTPTKNNWSKNDLQNSDYTTTFSIGQNASFLIRLNKTYNTSQDTINTLFVVRDQNDNIVHTCTSVNTWTNMWYRGYCELDIPTLPDTAGNYTIEVYFNGNTAYVGSFAITD